MGSDHANFGAEKLSVQHLESAVQFQFFPHLARKWGDVDLRSQEDLSSHERRSFHSQAKQVSQAALGP